MKAVICTVVGCLVLTGAFTATATERFHGVLDDHGRPVPITLSVPHAAREDASAGTVRFGEPWACGFDLEPIATGTAPPMYFLKGPAPGRCAALSAGYLHSHRVDAGVQVHLFDRSNRAPALYSFRLTAVSP